MKKKKILILIYLFQISCGTYWRPNDNISDLISKDYSHFVGILFYINHFDKQNYPVIYLQDYTNGYKVCGQKEFTISIFDSKIIKSNLHIFSSPCNLSITSTDSSLVLAFANMKISKLLVDVEGNIFISTKTNLTTNIVKLANFNDTINKYGNWIALGNNWFRKP